jgi:hypothetical protein
MRDGKPAILLREGCSNGSDSIDAEATEGKSEEQGAFVDFLEEAGGKSVGDFEGCGENALGERIAIAGFICVHLWLRFCAGTGRHFSKLFGPQMNTDEHR